MIAQEQGALGGLSFMPTEAALWLSGAVLLVTAGLCWVAWSRSGFRRVVGLLELLRLVLVTLVVITLCQPEWLEVEPQEQQPTLVVLWDQSDSMRTRDVVNLGGSDSVPRTRAETVAPLLDESFWLPDMQAPSSEAGAAEDLSLVFEPFSSGFDPSASGSDINGALARVLDDRGGQDLRGVVLLSDGDWNVGGSPAQAASRYRMSGVPVFAVGIGSEVPLPDLELARIDAPTFGVVRKPLRIPFAIDGTIGEVRDVTVTLEVDGTPMKTAVVRVPAMGQAQRNMVWTPGVTGDFELTLRVSTDATEKIVDNNVGTAKVSIRDEALNVLVIESRPRWEYRYLRNALERDPGVEVTCLLFHPELSKRGGGRSYISRFPAANELSRFDVVFVGDVGIGPRQLTLAQARQLRNLVTAQASGLVFLPGRYGYQETLLASPLGDLYPVVPDPQRPTGVGSAKPGHFSLTSLGQRSLLTRLADSDQGNADVWRRLPGMNWRAGVLRATAGSEVLAVHERDKTEFGRVPLIVTKTYGTGKVLFMGTDSAWRWREGVEDTYHYRYWAQVARWMAYQRQMAQGQSMRLFYSPDRPQNGDQVTLYANVLDALGVPVTAGNVSVQAISPNGDTRTVRLQPGADDALGLFLGSFEPRESGTYRLVATCTETLASVTTEMSVQGASRERQGERARFDVLHEIAAVSRGRMIEFAEVQSLLTDLAELPAPDPALRRTRLWAHPVWCGLLILLLAVFWTGRKLTGAV